MELRHLRYFVAVAQEQSFSRAARRLNISQPPLSMQIRDLESELGTRLFNRTTRKVDLTPIGAAMLPEAIRILDQTRISFERLQSLVTGLRNRLRLGILPTVAIEPFACGLRSFRELYTGVELHLEQGSVEGLLEMVDEGRLDAASSGLHYPLADTSFARCTARPWFCFFPITIHSGDIKGYRGDPCRAKEFY